MRTQPLHLGRLFESEFERQAHARGYHVVKHCEQLGVTGTKAPMLTGPYEGLRLPDFTIFANGAAFWIEAKYKSRQAYYAIAQQQRHGIDLPNWKDYQKVCALSGLPGYLLIGEGSTGIIRIASFKRLAKNPQIHPASNAFPRGMVFWNVADFKDWGSFNPRTGQMLFDFAKPPNS
jgi:hypothetical protein